MTRRYAHSIVWRVKQTVWHLASGSMTCRTRVPIQRVGRQQAEPQAVGALVEQCREGYQPCRVSRGESRTHVFITTDAVYEQTLSLSQRLAASRLIGSLLLLLERHRDRRTCRPRSAP